MERTGTGDDSRGAVSHLERERMCCLLEEQLARMDALGLEVPAIHLSMAIETLRR